MLEAELQLALNKGFVVYKMPFKNEATIVIGDFILTDLTTIDWNTLNGFVVNSFDNSQQYVLQSEVEKTIPLSELEHYLAPIENSLELTFNTNITATAFIDYATMFKQAMELLQKQELKKIVLSRIQELKHQKAKNQLFAAIAKKYDSAFCYYLYSPTLGCWMAASPEKMFTNIAPNRFEIYALAGSMPKASINWTDKEMEEQELVNRFIQDELAKQGATDIRAKETETVYAGNIAHLRTNIEFSCTANEFSRVLFKIHPTPAVAGLPQGLASSTISVLEKHNRALYTGFLGPVSKKTGIQLFVNLRCMQLFSNSACLYIGGGITAKSILENEWQETELKSRTLGEFLS